MAVEKRRTKGGRDESPLAKILRFGLIPLIVLLLIVVIIYMDKSREDQEESQEIETVSLEDGESLDDSGEADYDPEDETSLEDSQESQEEDLTLADPAQYPLQQDAVLELTGLVQSYCEAKEECDPEQLAEVFGISDWSDEEKEEQRRRMELVKASVKSYENISCYSIQGPEPDSYVIFPYYEIRYRETETLMPAFSWGYVRRDETGKCYMVQEIDSDISEYIQKTGEKAEVKAVMAQILARQQEAIASDEVLQKIYGESQVIIGGVLE